MSMQELMNSPNGRREFDDKIRKNPERLKELDEKSLRTLLQESIGYKGMDRIETIAKYGVNLKIDPLEMALAHGDLKSVESLLSGGKKFDDLNWTISFLATYAFYKKISKDILLILFKYGVDAKTQDSQNKNLLHYFPQHVRNQNANVVEEIVDILLDAGIPVNGTDEEGWTPLFHAVEAGSLDLIEILIKKGADVNLKDAEERTLLHIAAAGHDKKQVLNFILSIGIDVNAQDEFQETALHIACYYNDLYKIDSLIQKGADLSVVDAEGETPFAKLVDNIVFTYSSLKFMVKKFSSMDFENLSISEIDMEALQGDADHRKLFEMCKNELKLMSSSKFYRNHSYYSLLKTSNNLRILAKLTKSKEFLKKFKTFLRGIYCYKSELRRVLKEAILLREKSKAVLSSLDAVFGDSFPDVVKRKLENHLTLEDLPLE